MTQQELPTLAERSRPGRSSAALGTSGISTEGILADLPVGLLASRPPALPEVSERDLVAHYTGLAHRTYSVDEGFYPLGSCTMKYNPRVADRTAAEPGFTRVHPAQPAAQTQGLLELLVELEGMLCALTGMSAVTFQPPAGAAGELTALLMIRAWLIASHGHARQRVLIPDQAHGTNAASAAAAGYRTTVLPSGPDGLVDVAALEAALDDDVAALMLTNPNTLGLFERRIAEIADVVHAAGAKLYYDGANLNAIVGHARPGDMGFDVVHINTHKTFATPHGGGGPGAGPVAVADDLVPYLPGPRPVALGEGVYDWTEPPHSIGRVSGWHGNIGVLVRAYTYIYLLGLDGLRASSARAVLNANYLLSLLPPQLQAPFPGPVMHEFVVSARALRREYGIRALDVAKALIDHGVHPPTMYFPLIVDEALMVEPTETESAETLERFAAALAEIVRQAETNPESLRSAPHRTPVSRPDETSAARNVVARWPEAKSHGEVEG